MSSLAKSVVVGLSVSLFEGIQSVDSRSISGTFTGTSLTSSVGEISLVENDDYNLINSDGYFECDNENYDHFCVQLDIYNTGCDSVETLEITVYGGRVANSDTDLFATFALENNDATTMDYLSYFNDWDGAMNIGKSGVARGGVFTAPNCDSTSLFTHDNTDIINTILEDQGISNYVGNRKPLAGGSLSNWDILTEERVGADTSPLKYTIINDPITNTITTSFDVLDSEVDFVGVGCSYGTSFDRSGTGNNYVIGFGVDQQTVQFTQFDVTLTCEGETNAPTNVPSNIPTSEPTFAPTGCDYTHECRAYGDPHIKTFDGTLYHFQGDGYFDYIKICDSNSSEPLLPFTISARHDECGRVGRTCVREVIVSLNDGTIISFPSDSSEDPTYKDSGSSAIGSGSFIDNNGETVEYTVSNSYFEITFVYDNVVSMLKFSYQGTTLIIETSDCLFGVNNICGLCGNINDDDSDDFTRCDTLEVIDNSDVSERIVSLTTDAWINTHLFGESCCNEDFDLDYLGESDCGDDDIEVPEEPDIECITLAEDICDQVYSLYCDDCDGTGATDEWLENCAFDVCADETCGDNVVSGVYTSNDVSDALNNGCLDTSVNECFVDRFADVIANIV